MLLIIKRIINKVIILFKKYCYISIPILTIIILIFIKYGLKIDWISLCQKDNSTLVGISGTLIGFLFTAMTIFFSLNKNQEYMQNFKRYKHHIIFGRLITLGILLLCINIFSWLIQANQYIVISSFILGIEESLMAAYYTYKLSLNSFK